LDLAYDDDRALRHEEVHEQASDEASPTLGRGNRLHEKARPDDWPQVQLADLIVTKKPRRQGKDGDFEVIPPVRSVIVLDDPVTPDMDFDEPWEHIYGVDDDMPSYEPSYAKIVSLN